MGLLIQLLDKHMFSQGYSPNECEACVDPRSENTFSEVRRDVF